MTTQTKALKLAQKALSNRNAPVKIIYEALHAIKEALAEPEQEPVAKYSDIVSDGGFDPRNTTPPQRTWVGLTQTQVKLLWEGVEEEAIKSGDSLNWVFYTHINEALKEKNNAPKRI